MTKIKANEKELSSSSSMYVCMYVCMYTIPPLLAGCETKSIVNRIGYKIQYSTIHKKSTNM